MEIFIQQCINGLVLGSMYALVALGYTMVYGIINLINFAHGEILMVGALTSWTTVTMLAGSGLPGWVIGMLAEQDEGEVVALGKGVTTQKVGDLVSVIPLKSCGHCEHCRKGEVQWCSGFGLQGGGYAEYAVTRPNQCVTLPSGLTLADGALIEPLAVALHGINLSGLKTGDKVLVLGAGPIGLAVAFWARRYGAAQVVVQDIARFQEQRALDMGADAFVVDPADPVGSAERALGGKADIVFECVGVPGLIAQAVDQVRPRGTILLLGLCTRPDTFNSFAMLSKEVKLVTSAFFTVPGRGVHAAGTGFQGDMLAEKND